MENQMKIVHQFIEVHSFDGNKPIIINISSIESIFSEFDSNTNQEYTIIYLNSGNDSRYKVRENYKDISNLLLPLTLHEEGAQPFWEVSDKLKLSPEESQYYLNYFVDKMKTETKI